MNTHRIDDDGFLDTETPEEHFVNSTRGMLDSERQLAAGLARPRLPLQPLLDPGVDTHRVGQGMPGGGGLRLEQFEVTRTGVKKPTVLPQWVFDF